MDAIGDVADRHSILRPVGIEPFHIARETSPCSDETALTRRASLSPSTVMQNCSPDSVGIFAAKGHQIFVRDAEFLAQRPKVLFNQIGVRSDRVRREPGCAS